MARVTSILNSFQAGELSPRLLGRTDINIYKKGCQTLQNMYVWSQGGATKRPGTSYIATAGDPDNSVRLIPFVYSNTQAYVLEFGDYYMRVYTDGGIVLSNPTSAGIYYSITTPYSASDLADLKFSQTADVIYITHPDYAPQKLSRYASNSWTITQPAFYAGPFLDQNTITGFSLTPSNTTGIISITVDNQITNGSFTGNIDNWNTIQRGTGSVSASSNAMAVIGDGTNYSQGEQELEVDRNLIYSLTFDVAHSNARLMISTSPSATTGDIVDYAYSTGSQTVSFSPSADTIYLAFATNSALGTLIDNVSLKADLFNVNQEGAYWKFAGTEVVTKSVGGANVFSDSVIINEGETLVYSFEGTWTATATLQLSHDEGATWVDVKQSTTNISESLTGTEDNLYYRAGIKTGDYGSGTLSVRLSRLNQFGYAQITDYVDEHEVTAMVKKTLPSTDSTEDWAEGAWSDYRGFPSTVTFFEQRLLFAGNYFRPQTIWASQIDDYENFQAGTNGDDAYIYTIPGPQVNIINWMVPQQYLLMGSLGGEWRFGFTDQATTPTNVDIKRQTSYGSSNIQGIIVGDIVLFLQKGRTKLRSLFWDYRIDGFKSQELSIMSEHLLTDGISEITFAERPDPQILMVTDTGNLVICSFEPDQNVFAFSEYTTTGSFESITVIPGTDRDEIWVVVKRTVDGSDIRFIEQFQTTEWTDNEDAYYMDSALEYNGVPTNSLSGMSHLANETISVLTDGATHPDVVVTSGGTISLQVSASKVIAGLGYNAVLETMYIDEGNEEGTAQSKRMKIHDVSVRLLRTIGMKAGYDADNLDEVIFRSASDSMDQAVPLFTGDKKISFDKGYDINQSIYLLSYQPLPFSVLAIIATLTTNPK